ncbi:hypothetical protein BJ944DRAFT_266406 [Cunninghamella echinulata]|nr:hypothetical protein BJ944DRAFT_266406 [Cunninghamella echinulata]
MDNSEATTPLLVSDSSTTEPRSSIEQPSPQSQQQTQQQQPQLLLQQQQEDNMNKIKNNNADPSPKIPIPYSNIQDIHNNNNNSKQCRICGEGEYECEDDGDDERYPIIMDEETLIRDPLQQHQAQLMTRYHSSSSWDETQQENNINNKTNHSSSTIKKMKKGGSSSLLLLQKKNPLIRPCKCKGTMMYVHVSCLNRWRTLSPRPSSFVACDLCGYEYNIFRPRYAAILTNIHFLRVITALLVLSSIFSCAYLCKAIDIYLLHHLPQPDNPTWYELHGPTFLWMDRFYLFGGVMIISMLGIAYLFYLCITEPSQLSHFTSILDDDEDDTDDTDDEEEVESRDLHYHHQQQSILSTSNPPSQQYQYTSYQQPQQQRQSFLCCDQTSCPWYSCYLADCAACSGDAAAGGFLIFVVLMSLMAILFGIMGAVTGVYRMMESFVERIAGHVKERILDVE